MESLAHDLPPDHLPAQITEVRGRIAEVEAGAVALIPGDEALAQVCHLVAAARAVS